MLWLPDTVESVAVTLLPKGLEPDLACKWVGKRHLRVPFVCLFHSVDCLSPRDRRTYPALHFGDQLPYRSRSHVTQRHSLDTNRCLLVPALRSTQPVRDGGAACHRPGTCAVLVHPGHVQPRSARQHSCHRPTPGLCLRHVRHKKTGVNRPDQGAITGGKGSGAGWSMRRAPTVSLCCCCLHRA